MFNEILKTKPHNPHYLNRYIKFITQCVNSSQTTKTEDHHICPKSSDLFPEFKSFKKYPWNKAKLTLRQHYIAHRLLWKAFGGKQTMAFKIMCERARATTSRAYETVRSEFILSMMGNANPAKLGTNIFKNINPNKDGLQAKQAWNNASPERRKQQSEIMKSLNKLKKRPKEIRKYKCKNCNSELTREEFCHHLPKEHYYCNSKCRNIFVALYRKSTLGISKPYKEGRVAWNKGKSHTGFGSINNPMKDPDKVAKMLETRRINKEKKRGTRPL